MMWSTTSKERAPLPLPAPNSNERLNKGLGLFESVQVSMDAVEDKDGSLDQTDVTVKLKEKNWYLLQSGATTSGRQGNLDASEFSNLRCKQKRNPATHAHALGGTRGVGRNVWLSFSFLMCCLSSPVRFENKAVQTLQPGSSRVFCLRRPREKEQGARGFEREMALKFYHHATPRPRRLRRFGDSACSAAGG